MKRFFVLLFTLVGPLVACASAPTHPPVAEEAIPPDTSSPTPPAPAATDETPSDATPADPPADADAKSDSANAIATKLDARNGFGAGTFGDAPKAYKTLKAVEKKPDHATYKVGGKNQYAGATLKEVQFLFLKGKLAKISFTAAPADCKAVHDAFERDFGTAQKHLTAPMPADVWRGNEVGLRFNNSGTACTGVMIRRELATTEWTGLDQ